jgi:hypothetical protein
MMVALMQIRSQIIFIEKLLKIFLLGVADRAQNGNTIGINST